MTLLSKSGYPGLVGEFAIFLSFQKNRIKRWVVISIMLLIFKVAIVFHDTIANVDLNSLAAKQS